jgi:hypothetical protein
MDGFGAGGSGAGATGGGGTTTSTTHTTTTVTTGTGGQGGSTTTTYDTVEYLCTEVCDYLEQICSLPPDCYMSCVSGYQEQCTTEYKAFLTCAVGVLSPPVCDPTQGCSAEIGAWEQCEGGNPPPCSQDCTGGGGTCSCAYDCSGTIYTAECTMSQGQSHCTCSLNGVVSGTCQGSAGQSACDPFNGCCAQYFAWD